VSERIHELLARGDELLADEVRRIPVGAVVSTPTLPEVVGLNVVRVQDEDADAATVAAIADLEQAALPRRLIAAPGESIGSRLEPGLRQRGYDAHRDLVMVHRYGPPTSAREAGEVSFERASPMLAAFRRTRSYADRPGIIEQLAGLDARATRALAARDFCAPPGEPLAGCRLFTLDGSAQIEHVGTLPDARGRGLAGAAVRAAIAAAYAAGLDPIFILADPGEWTAAWYARLGFEAVGERWEFGREAESGGVSSPGQ